MKHPLDGVRLKLVRAEEHLQAIRDVLHRFSVGECKIIPEEDKNGLGVLRIHLPKPPCELSIIVGDFLYGLRSALDHLVWQLVIANPPNTPDTKNMFPICSTPENFEDATKRRHRLRGVSTPAVTLIESLQPYSGRNQALRTLATLHDTDKHQTLNLVTAVASEAIIEWRGDNPMMNMFLGGEELRDGAIFGNIGMPLSEATLKVLGSNESLISFKKRFLNMKVEGQASMFVAFDKPGADELEPFKVDVTLQKILEFVGDALVPAFEPFFN